MKTATMVKPEIIREDSKIREAASVRKGPSLSDRIESVFEAITFAEAGEHDTAKKVLRQGKQSR